MALGLKIQALIFFMGFNFCFSKLIPIIYEELEYCVEPKNNARMFDFSQLEIFAETDTNVFLNGTWKFLKEVKSPWISNVFTERYERGQWNVELMNRRIPDFCESIQTKTEIWYHVTQYFEPKTCPFPAGVSA